MRSWKASGCLRAGLGGGGAGAACGGPGISTLFALSWKAEDLGPEGEVEKEGRCDWETELSARDLSCSDQLKPPLSPGRGDAGKSDAVLGFDCMLA
jgi:hypothetical protein